MKIDLGCGANKREGFTGVDKFEACNPDIVHDLTVMPWPFEDNSIDEVYSGHFVEHLDGFQRCAFFNELYRVMKPDAKALLIVPHASSSRAIQDWTHAWPPMHENSLYYLSRDWREQQELAHYHPLTCNFEASWGLAIHNPNWATREDNARSFATSHYINVIDDLHVHLIKK